MREFSIRIMFPQFVLAFSVYLHVLGTQFTQKDSFSYEEVPVEILDRQVRRLRNKEVASVKVLWRSQSVEGATSEVEAAMKSKYP